MKKILKTILYFLCFLIFIPFTIFAADQTLENTNFQTEQSKPIQISFRAEVIEVIDERTQNNNFFQDLRLKGKTGQYKNKEILYEGIEKNISSKFLYKKGDIVFLTATKVQEREDFLITDKSRLPAIYLILAIFVLIVFFVGRSHGLRALVSLVITFFVIVGFIVPRILAGAEPVSTVVISSLVIVIASMLIVYGWNKKSKIAISGMLIGVLLTAILSYIFSAYASLTGSSVEEVMFLKDFLGNKVDFRGLLLASFILGSLGVLDDIAVTQVSTTQEICEANKNLTQKELYKRVMRVGVDHISSMINTLFLAYAGASFILLLLFGLNQAPFETFNDVINNEVVATEIIRTLVGSIGLILTVPITTLIASYIYSKEK